MRADALRLRAFGVYLLIALLANAAAAQVDEPPVPALSGQPNLPEVDAEIADAVRALRVTARRLNRCSWDSREGFFEGPSACDDWISEIAAAPVAVRVHAVGLELVRETMLSRTSDLVRRRDFDLLWFSFLEHAQAVPYLLRALVNMSVEAWNAPRWFGRAVRALPGDPALRRTAPRDPACRNRRRAPGVVRGTRT